MRWRKQKQTERPLVAGRDRPTPGSASAPVYSYYARRAPAEQGRATSTRTTVNQERGTGKGRSLLQRLVIITCVVVALFCVGKILFLVPDGKVVVTGEVQGQQLPTERYAAFADKMLKGSVLNMTKMTLNTNGIAREMEREFPELSSVVVAVPLIGNRPVVYVAPTRPVFVLETLGGQYTIDNKGYVLSRVSQPVDTLLHLREAADRSISPGERYFAGSTMTFAITISYQLQKAGYGISYLDLPIGSPYELDVYLTGKPYHIRFNTQTDALAQSGGAVATLAQVGQDTPSQYLDMRTPERAYYK